MKKEESEYKISVEEVSIKDLNVGDLIDDYQKKIVVKVGETLIHKHPYVILESCRFDRRYRYKIIDSTMKFRRIILLKKGYGFLDSKGYGELR